MATGNIVEEIFKLNIDASQQIKELQNLAGSYQKITEEQRKQIVELETLREKERQLLAERNKSNNPTTQVRLTSAIKENKKQIDELTKSVVVFANESEEAKIEVNALSQAVSNAFKGTQINSVKQMTNTFGGLQNSVNQISRELPAFAVNANTGFLAISNNLPILFDNLQRVRVENEALLKSGQQGPSVFKQLGSAIFSVGSLLSVGVTLLTIYGGEIAKVIGKVIEGTGAFELETKALEILNDEYERQIKLSDDLIKSRNEVNKEIAKLKIGDAEKALLDVTDKASDTFNNIEKGYTKAVGKAIITQLQGAEKEVDIATRRVGNIIEIENKKTGTIIRLNREMNQVLGAYSAFYNKNILTNQDVALQAQISKLDKARQQSLKELNLQFNSEIDLLEEKESDKDKIRERFSQKELIRQRSALDEIRQLQIDNGKDEQQRLIEQANFDTEKKIRAIDEANELEAKKLAIAKANFAEKVRVERANEKDERQLQLNLIKLNEDFSKEVQRIRAENIPKEQQAELRLRLEEELFRKLKEINDKFQKELDDKIKDDVKRTYEARVGIINDNNETELFLLEKKYEKQKKLGDKASQEELKRLRIEIYEKKKLILDEQEAQELGALKRNEAGEQNQIERLEVETKYANKRRRLEADLLKEFETNDREAQRKRTLQYIDFLSQIIHATLDAANKIIAIKIKENEVQTREQEKRVDQAKNIADRGNAELLQLEQERLDKLNKQREKYVRAQQALAAVELVANTAIAVSKAAAQGGVAAGVTIAAALIALVAGLASARSIASQAAYYDGGLYEGDGFTGSGNPREESSRVGRKPYIYHKEEFIFNHKATRKYRDIFQDIHAGKVDLNEWKAKSSLFDQISGLNAFTMSAPTQGNNNVVNIIQFRELEGKMDEMIQSVSAIKFGLNIDEQGFTEFMSKRIARKEQIKNLAKL